MRYRYIIPLVLGALMVMAAMPVNALSSHQLNNAYSEVDDNFAVAWSSTPQDQTISGSSAGDIIWWNNQYKNNDQYSSQYSIGLTLTGAYNEDYKVNYMLGKGQSWAPTLSFKIQSLGQFNRVHVYGGNSGGNPFEYPHAATSAAKTTFTS